MDISSVGSFQLSNLKVVTPRAQSRLQRPEATSEDSQQVEKVVPRNRDVGQRLDVLGKIQQAFVSALRTGQNIEQQGLFSPIQ